MPVKSYDVKPQTASDLIQVGGKQQLGVTWHGPASPKSQLRSMFWVSATSSVLSHPSAISPAVLPRSHLQHIAYNLSFYFQCMLLAWGPFLRRSQVFIMLHDNPVLLNSVQCYKPNFFHCFMKFSELSDRLIANMHLLPFFLAFTFLSDSPQLFRGEHEPWGAWVYKLRLL